MWINPNYSTHDLDLAREVIRRYPLATLIAGTPLLISHMPVLLTETGDSWVLEGHIPRADPLCDELVAGRDAVVVFTGPSSYITPSWYTNPGLPTYNFVPIHASGRSEPIEERALRDHLSRLIDSHETHVRWDRAESGPANREADQPSEPRWTVDEAARLRTDRLIGAIQGFRIPIDRLEIKAKVGQNRAPAETLHTAESLRISPDPTDRFIADRMTETAQRRVSHSADS